VLRRANALKISTDAHCNHGFTRETGKPWHVAIQNSRRRRQLSFQSSPYRQIAAT